MKKLSYIRAGFLASSLLLSSALSMSAFAEDNRSLPNLSPSEISRDVTREFNNRTGTEEFTAPTFDPFEQDRSMAGAVSLRSIGGGVTTIDGDVVSDGAILDMNFYYNSASDDPYDLRGFTDMAFLSGSLAPAVRRDNRILECSRNVENVVYDHRYYTTPLFLSIGLNRGFRHYSGHRGYGRFDRPYWRNRGFGNFGHGRTVNRGWGRTTSPRSRTVDTRDNRTRNEREVRRIRDQDRDRNNERNRSRGHNASSTNAVRADRNGRMRQTLSTGQERARNSSRSENRNNRAETRTNEQRANNTRAVSNNRQGTRTVTQNSRVRPTTPAVASTTERAERRVSRSDRKNPSTQQTRSKSRQQSAPKQRSNSERRSTTKQRSSTRTRSRNNNSSTRRSNTSKRVLNFFPENRVYGRNIVSNVSVDCARQETLSVFIPAQRLEAARFDGLTVLALDGQGQEYPVFIPPNYIEGFKQAIGGQYIRSSGMAVPSTYAPESYTAPYVSEVRPQPLSEVSCPTGTRKQADGTCLLVQGSYPR